MWPIGLVLLIVLCWLVWGPRRPSAPPSTLLLVRNRARDIEGAVRWLANRLPSELVVVDRGSTDETVEILKRLRREYPDLVIRQTIGSPGVIDLLAEPVGLVIRLDQPGLDLGALKKQLSGSP